VVVVPVTETFALSLEVHVIGVTTAPASAVTAAVIGMI
jgi:hypothetical protein